MEKPAQIMGEVSLETTPNDEIEDSSKNSQRKSAGEQSHGPKKPATDRVQPP